MSFTDNKDGTGTISGTPADGSAGTYAVSISATNVSGSTATLALTITVNAAAAPTLTIPAADFTQNQAGGGHDHRDRRAHAEDHGDRDRCPTA